MITFSFRPSSGSDLAEMAASVSTRVVSWKEAADSHESVASDAFVIPSRTGRALAGAPPFSTISAFVSSNWRRATMSPGRNSVSPGSMMCTLRSICRAISSMCLSWIVTPWLRYTCWTSSTRCCWSASTPSTRSFSCGFTEPSVSCWPTSTGSPSLTVRRARNETGYSTSSPESSVTRMRRTCFSSSSSIVTVPESSVICASPLGLRASNSSTTRGRPCVMSSPATPPVWNVRIVSCVPGSPIDWAAMMPTASPMSTIRPLASERP